MITKTRKQLFIFKDGATQGYPNSTSDDTATVVETSDYVAPTAEPTSEELVGAAEIYLASTDWVEGKYTREVIRNKSMTEDEFTAKYYDTLNLRENAIATVSAYEDSL